MRVTEISGKRVLFFSPAFFGYEKTIADKMREMGADVDMYDVRSVTSAINRALLKICPCVFYHRSLKYYEEIIEKNRGKDYDYILIIKCDMTPIKILREFRGVFPKAKLCLNLWDSIDNIRGISEKFCFFDTIHSFDPSDCGKYKELKFLPLFFCDQFRNEERNEGYIYDISFLGTIHSDRYAVIKQVQEIAEAKGLKCYWFLYLQSRFIFYFYKFTKKEFRGAKKNTFSFEKRTAVDIADVVSDSRIILDIHHPKQTGLTMRTIEMIGMKKKIITTNESIKQYDFYNQDNVSVVNRKHVVIPDSFLNTPYKPLTHEVYEKYSIKNWILEVFS